MQSCFIIANLISFIRFYLKGTCQSKKNHKSKLNAYRTLFYGFFKFWIPAVNRLCACFFSIYTHIFEITKSNFIEISLKDINNCKTILF